jgi:hypothetical protein
MERHIDVPYYVGGILRRQAAMPQRILLTSRVGVRYGDGAMVSSSAYFGFWFSGEFSRRRNRAF